MPRIKHLNEEELALYVDGLRLRRLDAVPAELLNHVQDCFECKKAVMELSSLIPDAVYRREEPHPFFDRKPMPLRRGLTPAFRVAAGLVLLFAAGVLFYYASSHWTGTTPAAPEAVVVTPDSAKSTNGPDRAAGGASLAGGEAFAPMPMYERLATQEFRSAAVRVIRPGNGDTISRDQRFSWEGGNPREPYGFSIITNTGEEPIAAEIRSATYRLRKALPEGRYYWKLEQGGELLFVGKFFVARSDSLTSR